MDYRTLVVDQNVRPERPLPDEVPQLVDGIWEQAEHCWVKDPSQRPTTSYICTILSNLDRHWSIPDANTCSPSRLPLHSHNSPPLSTYTTALQDFTGQLPDAGATVEEEPHVQHGFRPRYQHSHVRRLSLEWSRSDLTAVRSVAFSPNGTQLASSHRNGAIVVWNARTGSVVCAQFNGHTHSVHSIAFSPDRNRIVSGSRDKTIIVWDVVTGKSILPLTGHAGCVTAVALSPNGRHIMSGSKDGSVRFWNATTGEVLISSLHKNPTITSVAFSPDGSWAVAGSSELEFWSWDAAKESWQWCDYPEESFQKARDIMSVAVSCGGKIIACGSGSHIQVWNSHSGELLMPPYSGNDGMVSSVAISSDGKLIVSGSYNSTFRVWDVDTGQPVAEGPHIPSLFGLLKHTSHKGVYSVDISSDNQYIVVGTASDIQVYSYI